ncbi:MFS transporter [Actinomycetospora sp. OC33-EN08]|uniref:MFS transporter n=1 Tax=Actinomycetospora aurantiaca TaxID=3129233 RepID=A0ABU8MWT1_9PSEU
MTDTAEAGAGGTPANITVTDDATMKRAVGAAAVGNITEWFDFGVYAYLATTIESNFFPPDNPTLAQIGVFAGFAVSFLVRPLGGLFFGPLGDRIGRTKVLSITVIMMAIGTFLLGFIPPYSAIGIWAPILLVLCRVVQGFSTGGEYAGAMTFIAEYSPDRRRGFFGSFLECGTFIGYALGATVATVIPLISTPEFAATWAWRIPFFIALPLGIVGVYLRVKLEETPAFQTLLSESEEREGNQAGEGIKKLFVTYWPAMLTAGGLVVAWNILNYMLTSYMPTYLEDNVSAVGGQAIDTTTSQVIQIVILWVGVFVIPALGMLSDRVGRKPLLLAGSVGTIVLAFPMLYILQLGSVVLVGVGLGVMGLLLVLFASTCPSTLPAQFPTEVRYGGLSISFNIFVSAFAGTTSLIMTALVLGTGWGYWPAAYLVFAGVVGLVVLVKLKDPAGRPLLGSNPAVSTPEEARELEAAGVRRD